MSDVLLRDSATEALTLEIVDLLADRTVLPSGHHVAYGDHHFNVDGAAGSSSVGVVDFEVYTEAGVTPVRITVEAR